jgi:membrane protein implicated in regulation of membrane protease activity
MELWLIWLVVGFVLVIAELVSGTFYLLVLAAGAFAASLVDYAGGSLLVQAFVAGLVAVGGTLLVHHWHGARGPADARNNLLDLGQPVVLEGWSDEPAGIARVRYRGASWEARVASGAPRPPPGATLYIDGMDGNTLVLVAAPPSR